MQPHAATAACQYGWTPNIRALARANAKQVARLYRQAFGAYSFSRDDAANQMRIPCSRMPQQPYAATTACQYGRMPNIRALARVDAKQVARLYRQALGA